MLDDNHINLKIETMLIPMESIWNKCLPHFFNHNSQNNQICYHWNFFFKVRSNQTNFEFFFPDLSWFKFVEITDICKL